MDCLYRGLFLGFTLQDDRPPFPTGASMDLAVCLHYGSAALPNAIISNFDIAH